MSADPLAAFGPRPPVAGGLDLDVPGDGVRLRATRWAGPGTPVVFLHGLSQQRRFWDLVVERLGGLSLLTLDQRGHGESEVPESGYDVATLGRDAVTALDAVGWQRVVVVGHSWGAATAMWLAANEPSRVATVVCIDGGFGGPPATVPRDELRTMLEPPRIALPPDDLRAMLRESMNPWWSPEAEAAVLPSFAVGADGLARARLPFERHMQVVDGMLDNDPAASFDRVRCPAWLVGAEPAAAMSTGGLADPVRAGWAAAKVGALAAAADRLAQPRLLRWGGAVHDVPLQWPSLVAGLVRAAVDENGEGVAG